MRADHMDALTGEAIQELQSLVGTAAACAAVGCSRATYYRRHHVPATRIVSRQSVRAPRPRTIQPRALSAVEQAEVRGLLHSERFVDQAPATVYATLLDEERYLCSVSTMYRVLRADGETREDTRAAPSGNAPCCGQARAAGDAAKRGLELGHHAAARSREVDLLLLVRRHRHLQPLRPRLAAGHA